MTTNQRPAATKTVATTRPTTREELYRPALRPDEYDDQLTAALDRVDEAGAEYARSTTPDNTRLSYESDWRAWMRFATEKGFPLTAGSRRGVLVAYTKWLWEQGGEKGEPLSPATVERRLSGLIVTLRREYDVLTDPDHGREARTLIRALAKEAAKANERARGRGKAEAVTVDMLRAMSAACPDTLTGLRDRSVLLASFALAARRHEVAALSVVDMQPVRGKGLLVNVRVSKTHPRKVAVPHWTDKTLCPVCAWLKWQRAADLEPETPAFRRMHRTGSVTRAGLSPQSIGKIITDAGIRVGYGVDRDLTQICSDCPEDEVQIKKLTGHSMRRGLITEAHRAGNDQKTVSTVSGHTEGSRAYQEYVDDEDMWTAAGNPLIELLENVEKRKNGETA